jgi:predicted HTH transcriptional regulator
MERIGSGIKFMIDETKHMGLPGPQFRETSEFVVSFSKAPALSPPPPPPPPQPYQETMPWGETGQLSDQSEQAVLDAQESRLLKAVQYVNEHRFITNRVYCKLTGISDRTATRDLELLVERGRLRGIGKRRSRRYELP